MREKIINLIVIHIAVLFALFMIGYFIRDIEIVRKRQEQCKKICYPQKVVESMSMRKCVCYEEDDELY